MEVAMGLFQNIFRMIPKQKVELSDLDWVETKSLENAEHLPDGEYPVLEREILPEKIICPGCGAMMLDGMEECDSCGAELN